MKELFLRELGFKKKVLSLGEILYEKKYKTKVGIFDLTVFTTIQNDKPISIFFGYQEIKEMKWSEKTVRKWDDYFTKIGKIHFS